MMLKKYNIIFHVVFVLDLRFVICEEIFFGEAAHFFFSVLFEKTQCSEHLLTSSTLVGKFICVQSLVGNQCAYAN